MKNTAMQELKIIKTQSSEHKRGGDLNILSLDLSMEEDEDE